MPHSLALHPALGLPSRSYRDSSPSCVVADVHNKVLFPFKRLPWLFSFVRGPSISRTTYITHQNTCRKTSCQQPQAKGHPHSTLRFQAFHSNQSNNSLFAFLRIIACDTKVRCYLIACPSLSFVVCDCGIRARCVGLWNFVPEKQDRCCICLLPSILFVMKNQKLRGHKDNDDDDAEDFKSASR